MTNNIKLLNEKNTLVQRFPGSHRNPPEEINNEFLPLYSLHSTYTDLATPETHQAHSHFRVFA